MKKNWLKSKTFWAAVLGIAGVVGAYIGGTVDLTTAMTTVAGFLGAFGIRDSLA